MSDRCNLADVQGNILRGYGMPFVRHLIVRVGDEGAARRFLAASTSGSADVPQVRNALDWGDDPPPSCLNVGMTAAGLDALGLPAHDLNTFPTEFLAGAPSRAVKVGDTGSSAPEHWCDNLGDRDTAHVMWSIYGRTDSAREALTQQILTNWKQSGAFTIVSTLDGASLPDDPNERQIDSDEENLHLFGDKVHFGYRDSIAQPRFVVNGERIGRLDDQPTVPLGAMLLGYDETSYPDVTWPAPSPDVLSKDGTFNAFRVLEQDVIAFEEFLEETSRRLTSGLKPGESPKTDLELRDEIDEPLDETRLGWGKEFIAAKLMGRWRNGVPLVMDDEEHHRWPDSPLPTVKDDAALNEFDYPDASEGIYDYVGVPCPVGAHIRRGNPRTTQLVQGGDNHTRPIVRRGTPYGPPFDPDDPEQRKDTTTKRGLLGNFFCASLVAQFEGIMYDWINLGLQHPTLTRTNDPIIGANDPMNSRFDIPITTTKKVTLKGFPRFTTTVAGVYLFYPALPGIRHLGQLKGTETT